MCWRKWKKNWVLLMLRFMAVETIGWDAGNGRTRKAVLSVPGRRGCWRC